MTIKQLDTFPEHMDITPYACLWEHFPAANVIVGGTPTLFVGSMKRKFEELLSVNHLVQPGHKSGGRPPLAFYDHELPGETHNSAIPLLVQAGMANFDVRWVLIDTRASCDIMYTRLFKTLQLTESNLAPYVGTELYGFNGSSTKPQGYVELIVTYGEEDHKDPILGDRLNLPLQLHHREDWTGASWGRMLNCPLEVKVSCRQQHNNNPARRHRGCPKMLPTCE